jgi:hypothetical protein
MRNYKKILGITMACLAGVGISIKTNAQATANANLNVVLADIKSIKVNPAQSTVTLNFATSADYLDGVFITQAAHLEITSTSGFQVKVKAATASLVNGVSTIPVSTILLTPTLSAGSVDEGAAFTPVSLSATPQPILNTPNGNARIYFDMQYKASGGQDYINKAAGTYVTTITYSIEPA